MRYQRLLAMFVLSVATGLGSAEAATFGPPASMAEAERQPGLTEPSAPSALGSPCFGSMVMADRQEMAFTLDLFSMGPMGYAPAGPAGGDNSVLGLLCRLADNPIGRN